MSTRNIPLVIIPTRGYHSMHRLRKEVDDEIVNHIIEYLLNQTLSFVSKKTNDILIFNSDKSIDLSPYDLSIVFDDGKSLNSAIIEGLKHRQEEIFCLIMPDLPGLDDSLLEKALHLHKLHPYIIVPTHDMGTAMAILPKDVYLQGFLGSNSATKIIEYCDQKNYELAILETEGSKYDLDTMHDLKHWQDLLKEKIPKINEIVMINQ